MRVEFPGEPQGQNPPIINKTVSGQPSPSLPNPPVQVPPRLGQARRQYPNLPRHWFASDEAHAGVSLAFRSLFNMNYDQQDAIHILTRAHPGLQVSQQTLGGNGAINPNQRGNYLITSPAAAALTLSAPRAGIDDGTEITLSSNTAFAHVITTPGLLQTGSAAVNTATWAAFPGASLHLRAWAGKWNVMSSNGIAFA